ncbi:alpha and gamma adaptin binding protein p34-domain-containing protein [Daldinia sp. FL1419]|nr:alpha and gamma adaptin binding protein p34-domain-containing protein [Daldinia sp. FL1419]
MDISNPRRILAVSLADSTQHLTRVIKDLTGSHPEQTSTSLAGSSHNLSLKTAYYTAEVPIWLDVISSPPEWSSSFLSSEAKEVLEVLGGVVVVFSLPLKTQTDETKAAQELIQNVGKVVKDGLGGWSWDGVGLCLGVGEIDDVDQWEDCCAEWGLEFVQVKSQSLTTRNEFGEKTGIPRALEALESNDWSQASAGDLGSDLEDLEAELSTRKRDKSKENDGPDIDPESLDFGFDREDFAGLKQAIWNSGKEDEDFLNGEPSTESSRKEDTEEVNDEEIKKIERMMVKLQAVRDTSAGLPEEQRKRVAAKAVAEVMKEL